jgi:hypothetical protein
MDATFITAVAAASGSVVGAAATIVANWITQRTLKRSVAEKGERAHRGGNRTVVRVLALSAGYAQAGR